MRIWHYQLLPYLPKMQFKGQWRELLIIMRDWRDKGTTNHLLINHVMDYPKSYLTGYALLYDKEYNKRYNKKLKEKNINEFIQFTNGEYYLPPYLFSDWHNKKYLRICMANLYEKHLGKGKSKISDEEWQTLVNGYQIITGEEYKL